MNYLLCYVGSFIYVLMGLGVFSLFISASHSDYFDSNIVFKIIIPLFLFLLWPVGLLIMGIISIIALIFTIKEDMKNKKGKENE